MSIEQNEKNVILQKDHPLKGRSWNVKVYKNNENTRIFPELTKKQILSFKLSFLLQLKLNRSKREIRKQNRKRKKQNLKQQQNLSAFNCSRTVCLLYLEENFHFFSVKISFMWFEQFFELTLKLEK